MDGGASANDLLMQLQADILQARCGALPALCRPVSLRVHLSYCACCVLKPDRAPTAPACQCVRLI